VGSKAGAVAREAADAMADKLTGQNAAHKVSEVVDTVSSTVTRSRNP
jgi:hypothetical protein